MTLSIEFLEGELKESLKAKEATKSATLRMLIAALRAAEKEKKYKTQKDEGLTAEEVEGMAASEAKKRRESIEAFEKAGRPELAAQEKEELNVLLAFLPEQLTEQEIEVLVQEAIASTGATTQKEMGKVMAALAPKIKGRADGSLVSTKVKSLLS